MRQLAESIDVGPNLLAIALAFFTLVPTVVTLLVGRKLGKSADTAARNADVAASKADTAASVAAQTARQLTNNGGSSALDKLQSGHDTITRHLQAQDARQDTQEATLEAVQAQLSTISAQLAKLATAA